VPQLSSEEQTLLDLLQRHHLRRSGPTTPNRHNVVGFLESGDYNWVHFATHGSFFPESPDGDSSFWLQEDYALSPQYLTGTAIRRKSGNSIRPFLQSHKADRPDYALIRIIRNNLMALPA
jgi:hypothetical protein